MILLNRLLSREKSFLKARREGWAGADEVKGIIGTKKKLVLLVAVKLSFGKYTAGGAGSKA